MEAIKLLELALHLRMHGENAPGGTETWADWERRTLALLYDNPTACNPSNT
jgi:hypothetical protein